MNLKLKRTPGIYLTGFMGSGKSTIGRALAGHLGWPFVDLDEEIEKAEGSAISDIFEARGEAAFRSIEAKALEKQIRFVATGQPRVIALGGGTFVSESNREAILGHGISVWLDCPLATMEQRVAAHRHRPLARDTEKFRALFEARKPGYSLADYRIEIDSGDPAGAVAKILALDLF